MRIVTAVIMGAVVAAPAAAELCAPAALPLPAAPNGQHRGRGDVRPMWIPNADPTQLAASTALPLLRWSGSSPPPPLPFVWCRHLGVAPAHGEPSPSAP